MSGVETAQATGAIVGIPREMVTPESLLHLHAFQVLRDMIHQILGDIKFLIILNVVQTYQSPGLISKS